MSSVVIAGDTSGTVTLQAPAVAGSTVLTLPASTGTVMVNGPAFSAYRNTNQTLALTATAYDVIFNTEEYDTNSNFDTSTGIFTPTVAGYYQLNSSIQLGAATTITQVRTDIYKNGSIFKNLFFNTVTIATTYDINGSCLVYLNGSTDYVSIRATITGTGALTVSGSAANQTWFNGFLARGA